MKDIENMPFDIIDMAEFENGKLRIIFISGNGILCSPPNEKEYNIVKEVFIRKMPKDKVVIK